MTKSRIQSLAFQAFMALFFLMGLAGCGRGLGLNSGLLGPGGGQICTLIGYITFSVSVTSQNSLDPSSLTLFMSHNNGPFREQGHPIRDFTQANTFYWDSDPVPGLYRVRVGSSLNESEEKMIVLEAPNPRTPCGPSSQPAHLSFTLP